MFLYVGTCFFARLHLQRHPLTLEFCAPSLTGLLLLYTLFVLYILYKLYVLLIYIHCVIYVRLLDLFRTVFPCSNGSGRLIMDTGKVHSIKHCHVDVTNYANPINCSCDTPEGGHRKWIHEQGLKTNQGPSAAET